MIRSHLFIAVVIFVAAPLALLARAAGAATGEDLAQLTNGVRRVASPGTPGTLALVGAEAMPVVLGSAGRDVHAPVIAATRYGRGRVVAFAHGGYVLASEHDTRALVTNAIEWAAGDSNGDLRIAAGGIAPPKLAPLAEQRAWTIEALRDVAPGDVDVLLVAAGAPMSDEEIRSVQAFVRRGGGLLVFATGWGWQQLNGDLDLATDGPMNRLGAAMGIVWTNDTAHDTADDSFVVEPIDPLPYNARRLLQILADDPEALNAPGVDARQVERTLTATIRAVDARTGPLRDDLARFRRAQRDAKIPTAAEPLPDTDVAARVALLLETNALARAEPQRVEAHPAADVFPGAVTAGAPRAARTVTVDTSVPRWHSTGLYAVAGRPVKVEQTSGPLVKGLHVRIGCHTDDLGAKDKWRRAPRIAMRRAFTGPETTLASPFGGLVYLEVPKGAAPAALTFRVRGAVAAPTWVQGQTTLEQWRRRRHDPAPWGELASDRVILSLPSDVLRDLDDPGPVMDFWNDVLDACADLSGRPRQRSSPERIVPDVQISAGYMHSGYPIMTHLDVKDSFVNLEKLRSGQWGFFHELGHNHQSRDWTFGGTGEVTCNLFSLYVYDRVCGKGLDSEGLHDAIVPAKRRQYAEQYAGDHADFATWKRKPFVALTMYVQLAEAFGWEAYEAVFRTYRELPENERPRDDQAKRDQWMVRFSKQVGRDVSPLFDRWGVPVSAEARAQVAELEPWSPEGS